jgi:hypothetical protein
LDVKAVKLDTAAQVSTTGRALQEKREHCSSNDQAIEKTAAFEPIERLEVHYVAKLTEISELISHSWIGFRMEGSWNALAGREGERQQPHRNGVELPTVYGLVALVAVVEERANAKRGDAETELVGGNDSTGRHRRNGAELLLSVADRERQMCRAPKAGETECEYAEAGVALV